MSVSVLAVVGLINDALAVASALTPLIHNALSGGQTTVSDAEVIAARAKLTQAINDLDAEIARRKGTSP